MLVKKQVIQTFKKMPDEFSVDEAIEKLIVLNKIEKARSQIEEGKRVEYSAGKKETTKMAEITWAPSALKRYCRYR